MILIHLQISKSPKIPKDSTLPPLSSPGRIGIRRFGHRGWRRRGRQLGALRRHGIRRGRRQRHRASLQLSQAPAHGRWEECYTHWVKQGHNLTGNASWHLYIYISYIFMVMTGGEFMTLVEPRYPNFLVLVKKRVNFVPCQLNMAGKSASWPCVRTADRKPCPKCQAKHERKHTSVLSIVP